MSALDHLLDELAVDIRSLDGHGRSTLFRACGRALRPLYEQWSVETGSRDRSALLEQADAAIEDSMRGLGTHQSASGLLGELELATPPGDAVGDVSSTSAQACWIAYDTALRVVVDSGFAAEACIEYVLEPVVVSASERLFGFSQVGSGANEDAQMLALVSDARVEAAVRWVREATEKVSSGQTAIEVEEPHPLVP